MRFPTGIGFGFRYGKGLCLLLLQNALGVRAMDGLHTWIYIYAHLCVRDFSFPFVTFQVSRDFDVKFEKWEEEEDLSGGWDFLVMIVTCFRAILMIFSFARKRVFNLIF